MATFANPVPEPLHALRSTAAPSRQPYRRPALLVAIFALAIAVLAAIVFAIRPQPLSSAQLTQPVVIGDPLNRFPSQVGVLHTVFANASSEEVHYFCTASVVARTDGLSRGPSILLSAAHCVTPSAGETRQTVRSATFFPGRHLDGEGQVVDPYGAWDVTAFVTGWGPTIHAPVERPVDRDIAFGVVCPRDGITLETAVGSARLDRPGQTPSMVTATGYPRRIGDDDTSNDGAHPWLLKAAPSRTGSLLMGFNTAIRLPGDPAVIAGGMSGAPVMYQDPDSHATAIGWVITSRRTSSPIASRVSPSLTAQSIGDQAWSDYLLALSLTTTTPTEWSLPSAPCR